MLKIRLLIDTVDSSVYDALVCPAPQSNLLILQSHT